MGELLVFIRPPKRCPQPSTSEGHMTSPDLRERINNSNEFLVDQYRFGFVPLCSPSFTLVRVRPPRESPARPRKRDPAGPNDSSAKPHACMVNELRTFHRNPSALDLDEVFQTAPGHRPYSAQQRRQYQLAFDEQKRRAFDTGAYAPRSEAGRGWPGRHTILVPSRVRPYLYLGIITVLSSGDTRQVLMSLICKKGGKRREPLLLVAINLGERKSIDQHYGRYERVSAATMPIY